MATKWQLTLKPTFTSELRGLPQAVAFQVLRKIEILETDPAPSGKPKKRLRHQHPSIYRLRAGDYRVFYTFNEPYVSLLSLRKRDDDTYEDMPEGEDLGGWDPELGVAKREAPDWERFLQKPDHEAMPLPEPISIELLERMGIPEPFHARLLRVSNRDELLDCESIPDDYRLRIDEFLFEKSVDERLAEPDLLAAGGVEDLLRFKEGTLLGFLLRLNPEQEEIVNRAMNGGGPVLVKGGPGTGKSTVALYRTKAILERLPREPEPRVLFTTYTNALVAFSRQLLEQLLGEDQRFVEVRTADSLAYEVVTPEAKRRGLDLLGTRDRTAVIEEALETTRLAGNSLEQLTQRRVLEKLSLEYLGEEIFGVIEARGLATVDDYLDASRSGRKVAFRANTRRAVWSIRERVLELLAERRRWTFEQLRGLACETVERGDGPKPYDAVVVDEAQDLDPTLLRMLTRLCRQSNRLFVTADANQSIYGGGFRWQDVHEELRFRGRTALLKANHRSTREIAVAATGYLKDGVIDADPVEQRFLHTGPPPAIRHIQSHADEVAILARFLPGASRAYRMSVGATAVLVPTNEAGKRIAARLGEAGVASRFMTGRDLDLKEPVVKVITLKSAKGLEFPVVALAGFPAWGWPPTSGESAEAIEELVQQERRTMFVAMTRAMRALLVVLPQDGTSPLFEGFDPELWNTRAEGDER